MQNVIAEMLAENQNSLVLHFLKETLWFVYKANKKLNCRW